MKYNLILAGAGIAISFLANPTMADAAADAAAAAAALVAYDEEVEAAAKVAAGFADLNAED